MTKKLGFKVELALSFSADLIDPPKASVMACGFIFGAWVA
jgi:hypothetical protein